MKKEIHPTYHTKAKVVCACGKTYKTGSTVEEISIDLCSGCHPFYTGKQKLVDTAGRVEKFLAKRKRAQANSGAGDDAAAKDDSAGDEKKVEKVDAKAASKAKKEAKKAKEVKKETPVEEAVATEEVDGE